MVPHQRAAPAVHALLLAIPVDAAIGRYTRVVAEYVARVRAGDEHGAAKALARIEPARLAMITACEKFNARWGKADVRT
jgi:hypothetical protein